MEISERAALTPRTAGNENTGLLKVIAIVCMIIDHVGAVFFPRHPEMRLIGRIAFPLFCWCIVVGVEYTRNIWMYALRLLLVGALAQPCFMLGLRHEWYQLNVFATLLVGVLALAGIRKKWHASQYWAPVLALLCSMAVSMDYGWRGVALILMLYACRKSRPALAALMTGFCLYWGFGTIKLSRVFGIPAVLKISWLPYASSLLSAIVQVQFWAILALPLMLIPMKGRLKLPKWVAYAAYPVHLLIIGLIRSYM